MRHDPGRRRWLVGAAAGLGVAAANARSSAGTVSMPIRRGATLQVGASTAITRTSHGDVRGFTRDGVHMFRGIPYAGAPTGPYRFRRAPALAAWDEVRNAFGYGAVCPRSGGSADISQLEWALLLPKGPDTPANEDCLRANVWTRGLADGARRPIIVWLHSQGFGGGSSQEFLANDGENLARRHDVVVVTVNHRVGVLGFLGIDDEAANVGMLDLVDALRWVRANALAFGGDPDNVTIAGQSGGGFKVTVLLAMPEARGLFHKAIVQSGSRLRVHTPESARRLAAAALECLAIDAKRRAQLATIPLDSLLRAGVDAASRIEKDASRGAGFDAPPHYWQPTAGVPSLPDQPCDPEAPPQSRDIPLIVGSTRHELNASIAQPGLEALDWAGLAVRLQPSLGSYTTRAIGAARGDYPAAMPVEVLSILDSRRFRMSAIAHAERKSRQGGAPVFQYLFGWQTPLFDGRPRAFHTSDIAFAFLNTDLCDTLTGGGERPRLLAERMTSAWVAFARTGHPASSQLPSWPAYSESRRETMVLDDHCQVVQDPEPQLRALLQGLPV